VVAGKDNLPHLQPLREFWKTENGKRKTGIRSHAHGKIIVPEIVHGGHMINLKKSLGLMLVLMICASSAIAQKKAAKTSQAPAPPKKEITDADVGRVSVDELILMMANKKPVVIIDVRSKGGYTEKIKGALQIPLEEIEARMKEIPRNREIITYCA
jgi:hypothetical protein